ncbi:MAG: FAD-binding oxidoreductase [Gammaproteobacteria bacterium]|nr:FAD-binding oxidoreductase [Gammaproteobacteria bacterium]
MQTDVLIIGQGLAGSLLAWELIQRQYRVVAVDSGQQNASLISAGIINPITGMRFALTNDVGILLPAAQSYYTQLAGYFGESFYQELPMLRLFRNEAEQSFSTQRLQQPAYRNYIKSTDNTNGLMPGFSIAYGCLEQRQTGYLSVAKLLKRLQEFFVEQQAYRKEILDYRDIHITDDIVWNDINAKQIIFCEGYQMMKNPWFYWLPMQPVKGEMLTIETDLKLPNAILNNGHWLLPLTQHTARTGATFDRESINNQPTQQGKQALLIELKAMNENLANANILSHQAGIRPCSADRLPLIGSHPQHRQMLIFNGFGAKGSLQIPWYCQRFADYLQQQTPLPAACDIHRFQNRYTAG